MLEIKIQCGCGQRFKFDVEPVDGRMPFVVNCPICGLDGTAKANDVLGQLLPVSAPIRVTLASPAPQPGAPLLTAATVSPPPISPSALRITKPASPSVE